MSDDNESITDAERRDDNPSDLERARRNMPELGGTVAPIEPDPRPHHRRRVVRTVVLALTVTFTIALAIVVAYTLGQSALRDQRRVDNCHRDQKIYDGQFVLAEFIGEKLGATKDQIDDGLRDLAVKVGPRPHCER